jgi:hypothetical protein
MRASTRLEIVGKGGIRGAKEQRFYSYLDCLTLCDVRRALGSKCCGADGVVLSTNKVLPNVLGGSEVLLAWILKMLCEH